MSTQVFLRKPVLFKYISLTWISLTSCIYSIFEILSLKKESYKTCFILIVCTISIFYYSYFRTAILWISFLKWYKYVDSERFHDFYLVWWKMTKEHNIFNKRRVKRTWEGGEKREEERKKEEKKKRKFGCKEYGVKNRKKQ